MEETASCGAASSAAMPNSADESIPPVRLRPEVKDPYDQNLETDLDGTVQAETLCCRNCTSSRIPESYQLLDEVNSWLYMNCELYQNTRKLYQNYIRTVSESYQNIELYQNRTRIVPESYRGEVLVVVEDSLAKFMLAFDVTAVSGPYIDVMQITLIGPV